MFCFQSEQVAGCQSCGEAVGFCDKKADLAPLQDRLTGALIGLARATDGNDHMLSDSTAAVTVEGLFATSNDATLDRAALLALIDRVDEEKRKLVPSCYQCACPCGRTDAYDMRKLAHADADIRLLKAKLLSGIRSVSAYAYRAADPGCRGEAFHKLLYKTLFAIGMDDWGVRELQPVLLEVDEFLRKYTAL